MEQLVRALEALPERTRTMFVLYKFEQLSQDTIAERYGISKSAVKQQIAKAMALLASDGRRKMKDSVITDTVDPRAEEAASWYLSSLTAR